jgi:hypothetical protein
MIILVGIFLGFVFSTLLGVIVLVSVPTFKLTIANFLVFLTGALVGTFTLVNFVGQRLNDPGNHLSHETKVQLVLLSMVVGGLFGGTTLVWVKKRFERKTAKALRGVSGRDK